MTYTPVPCDSVWLEFKEDYTVPNACDVGFRVDDPLDEQSYTPPNCNSIWFELKDIYSIPNGCSVTFQIGPRITVSYVEITPHDIEFNIDMSIVRTFSGTMMLPHDITILPEFDLARLDPVWEIRNDDVSIIVEIPNCNIEILPDMQMRDVEISIGMSATEVKTPTEADLPRGDGSGMKIMGWGAPYRADISKLMGWDKPTSIHINPVLGVFENKLLTDETLSPWKALGKIDIDIDVSAADLEERINEDVESHWESMEYADISLVTPNNSMDELVDNFYLSGHKNGIPVDRLNTIPWGDDNEISLSFTTAWNAPGPVEQSNSACWGPFSYYALCSDEYTPAPCNNVYFEFPNKYDLNPGVCKGLVFNVNAYMSQNSRCDFNHHHSGIRDNPIWVDPSNNFLTYPVDMGVYHMMNMILVEEVITGDPIEILHVDASIDVDSWLWSFNVTVASKCFLDKIKPVGDVLGNIKITMNGWEFLCTVESWSENRSFGNDAWTVSGRSPSMLFGGPIDDPKSVVISSGKQGQTIFEDYMAGRTYAIGWPYTLWEADFTRYSSSYQTPTSTGFRPYSDWYLPADTVTYTGKTDITFLNELADSIGAYIQTEPDLNVDSKGQLTVIPRYAQQPWNWNVANTNITWRTLNESQCVEVSRTNDFRTQYHAVNVLGEALEADGTIGAGTGSLYTNVVRDGWDSGGTEGSSGTYAEMITNPYITTSLGAAEKGRMTIGGSAEWVKHTLRVGMLCADKNSSTALFRPGDMISVIERGVPWYGQVIGVSVGAVSSGVGFGIEQTIEVEEYIGD